MKNGIVLSLLAVWFLQGCLSLGVTGRANPTANSEVVLGAEVDQNGRVRPDGKVIFDLF